MKKHLAIVCPTGNFGGMELDSIKLAKKLGQHELQNHLIELEDMLQKEQEKRPPLSLRDLALNGAKVMQLSGLSSGPLVGKLLEDMLFFVLTEPKNNTEESLTLFIRARMASGIYS